jgi:hypothetical protein
MHRCRPAHDALGTVGQSSGHLLAERRRESRASYDEVVGQPTHLSRAGAA